MTTQKDKARVWEIVDDMGGPAELARKLSPKSGKPLTTSIVGNWAYRGAVPRRYWQAIIKLSGGAVSLSRLSGVVE